MTFLGDVWDIAKIPIGIVAPPVGAAILADDVLNDGGVQDEVFNGGEGNVSGPETSGAGWGPGAEGYLGYGTPDFDWGGHPDAAGNTFQRGLHGESTFRDQSAWAAGQMANPTNASQAWENQELSDNESWTRGFDQAGALQLSREAAMGEAPSQAAWQMQQGLDQSLAAQQAQMGSARGNAGLALAGGNAAANSASLMNQTYGQSAALRAGEMAQARGLYGGLSGQVRDQDLQRLGQGSQMSQFNAGNTTNYQLGMGNVSNAYGQTGLGYYKGAMDPLNNQYDGKIRQADIGANTRDRAHDRVAGMTTAEHGRSQEEENQKYRTGGQLIDTGGKAITAGA